MKISANSRHISMKQFEMFQVHLIRIIKLKFDNSVKSVFSKTHSLHSLAKLS